MRSGGQVAGTARSGRRFSDTREYHRVMREVGRLERDINEGLRPGSDLYAQPDTGDLMNVWNRITGATITPRGVNALSFADALAGLRQTDPHIGGSNREERAQSATQLLENYLSNPANIPQRLVRSLRYGLAHRLEELSHRLQLAAHRAGEEADQMQDLLLAGQSLNIVHALYNNGLNYNELRTLENVTHLMTNPATERIGSGLLSLITRDGEGRVQFPARFRELVDRALTPSETDVVGESLIHLLGNGQYGLVQRFLRVIGESETSTGPHQQVLLAQDSLNSLLVSATSIELTYSRIAVIERVLDLLSAGLWGNVSIAVAQSVASDISALITYPYVSPAIERGLVEMIDRVVNPLSYVVEEGRAAADILLLKIVRQLVSLNYHLTEPANGSMSDEEKKYSVSKSVAATLLELARTEPLNGARVVLMLKALDADGSPDPTLVHYYLQPLMDPGAQVWLNGLSGVTLANIEMKLEEGYYASRETTWGGGGPKGSPGGAAPAPEGPPAPPAPVNPLQGRGATASSEMTCADIPMNAWGASYEIGTDDYAQTLASGGQAVYGWAARHMRPAEAVIRAGR